MGSDFNVNYREETIISRLENSRQSEWGRQLIQLSDCNNELARKITRKFIETKLIETTSVRDVEKQLSNCLGELLQAEDFNIQYAIAPLRNLFPRPNRISLYITVFTIRRLINHPSVVDIFGTDEDIYRVVNEEVIKIIK